MAVTFLTNLDKDDILQLIAENEGGSITGSGAPTTSTAGEVGQFYMDTATGTVYKCVAVSDTTYTWEEFGVADVYYATYGTTTNAELEAAYTAGKKIYCLASDGAVCPLYKRYSEISHCFYKGASYFYCLSDNWTEEDCPYEGQSNKTTEITSESTDDQYPSAKAVYALFSTITTENWTFTLEDESTVTKAVCVK